MTEIRYITFDEAISVYNRTIEKSGGGFSGMRDEGGIRSVLDFVQSDEYYPDFISKLTYLVHRFCTGHFFNDGNKRIALTIGVYFLCINKQEWVAAVFMKRMESIVYHVAANNISDDLLKRIVCCVVECRDYEESLKIEIANAISGDSDSISKNE